MAVTSGLERLEHDRQLLVALAAAVLALVVGIGAAAHASSPASQVSGTRVAAHVLLAGPVVAASEDVSAGEGRRTTTRTADVAIGSRVPPQVVTVALRSHCVTTTPRTSRASPRAWTSIDPPHKQHALSPR